MLCWGITQPLAGIVADRYGTARVLGVGALFAALGFLDRGTVFQADVFILSGVLVGVGTGACSFPIVIVALGKVMPAERRSFVMGLGTAAASLGMFVVAPVSMAMIDFIGWKNGILVISVTYLAILPFLVAIARVSTPTAAAQGAKGFVTAI
jgi:MFS family permease